MTMQDYFVAQNSHESVKEFLTKLPTTLARTLEKRSPALA
jgi:hypothetical protein